MNRTRRRAAAALVTAVLAGGGVAGCSTAQQAGAAAIIDGERIPVDRLQELTSDLVEAGADVDPDTREPFPAGEAQRRTLEKLITSRVLAEAAEEAGVEVSQGDVDRRYAEFVELAGGDEAVRQGLAMARNVPPSYARQYVRDLLTSELLAQELVPGSDQDPAVQSERQAVLSELLVDTGAQLDVMVNPRYGEWDPEGGAIIPLVSGGLATPEGGAPTDAVPPPVPEEQ